MKQVLVNSNKTYLFPLPETFDELLTNIINKVNTNNITIYHKSKVLTKNNFDTLNENLNILDVSLKLNGGAEYPVITNIIFNIILSGILTTILGTFLFTITVYTITKALLTTEERKKTNVYEFIGNLNIFPKSNKDINPALEILYFSIIYYIFSVIPATILLYTKKSKCPSYNPPYKTIYGCTVVPMIFIFLLIIFGYSQGNIGDPTVLYIILAILFGFCGYIIMYSSNNSLMEWEHVDQSSDQSQDKITNIINTINTDFYKIPIVALVIYTILRKSLIIGKNDFGKMTIPMLFILITFSYIGISPIYIEAFVKYISSPYSICN
jgi:hypothetical protein